MLTVPFQATILKSSDIQQRPSSYTCPTLSLAEYTKQLLLKFRREIGYIDEDPVTEANGIYQTLQSQFSSFNVNPSHYRETCGAAAAIAELCYPAHTAQERLLIAEFTWYVIHVDDLGHQFRSKLECFQRHQAIENDTREGRLLNALREHLQEYYKLWDGISVDCIHISVMEFINGCMLETMPAISRMKLADDAISWPYYLRRKSGCSTAFAYMLFPRSYNVELTTYIQVIEDITSYTNLVNDVLSFYKEELIGDTANYVHCRAQVAKKSVHDVLEDMFDEILDIYARVCKVLEHTEALIPWKRFANGYITFHFKSERYHLGELGF